MDILSEIIGKKRAHLSAQKELYPTKLLEKSIFFSSPTVSLTQYLQRADLNGIIAEIKRRSPSKGWINRHINVEELSIGYMQAGASALSVLTDTEYFGGKNEDLSIARKLNFCPILRKEFIVDEYQIVEARSIGADAILLIAAALSPQDVRRLAAFARSLGLEVLLEVHSADELKSTLCDEVNLLGINNRDLKTFKVSLDTSLEIGPLVPDKFVKVAESGISSGESLKTLRDAGFKGFLIGEAFMKHGDPAAACRKFIEEIPGNAH